MPNPPLSARPLALRMTQMQDLMQNPYAVYARSILKLEEPEAIDGEPDARLFGTLLHAVVERAVKQGGNLSGDQQKQLVEQALSAYPDSGKIRLFWHERLLRGLAFFCAEHQRNLDDYLQVQTEFL